MKKSYFILPLPTSSRTTHSRNHKVRKLICPRHDFLQKANLKVHSRHPCYYRKCFYTATYLLNACDRLFSVSKGSPDERFTCPNVRHLARGHMGTTTLGHGHLASCHEASCHLDKTVKYDILAPLELNMLIILQMHVLLCDTVVCCINLL